MSQAFAFTPKTRTQGSSADADLAMKTCPNKDGDSDSDASTDACSGASLTCSQVFTSSSLPQMDSEESVAAMESLSSPGTAKKIINSDGFPIDLKEYKLVAVDPWKQETLSRSQLEDLKANISLCRDAIVSFTAVAGAAGLGGHTGGPFDIVPEMCLYDAFVNACPQHFVPTFFDEAGHRVAAQYLFSVLHGHMPAAKLLQYRVAHSGLPGHPERGSTPGVEFSSGRLGHLWPHVNGVCRANSDKVVCMFGSDGSQMEGNDAEAARAAAASRFNVKLFIDDNDVTIAGRPSQYLKGYDISQTLRGHGIEVAEVCGEDIDRLFSAMRQAVISQGPFAVVIKRNMCPGVQGIEGTTKAHDVIDTASAIRYLEAKGHHEAVALLSSVKNTKDPHGAYLGAGALGACRSQFGEAVVRALGGLSSAEERRAKVVVVDSDLEGSCGLKKIRETYPEVFIKSGIMERANLSLCAGFSCGDEDGRQGVFATFAAFQEMLISEITMARLNRSNVLCHFSHSGCDEMADNQCHFGVNNFFADCSLEHEDGPKMQLFFPADVHQLDKVVDRVFWEKGLRFIYTSRSKTPELLDEEGKPYFGEDYSFELGRDDILHGADEQCVGYVISYGDALYRSLDAVRRLRKQGLNVGLVNKCHANVVDEEVLRKVGSSSFVLCVESQNSKTGLGIRLGTWLLERGLHPKFDRCGTHREGCGGIWEHAYHQGFDSDSIVAKVRTLAGAAEKSQNVSERDHFAGA